MQKIGASTLSLLHDKKARSKAFLTGADHRVCSRFRSCLWPSVLLLAVLSGCTVLATRPVQLMSDTAAAIRAAREVQADTLAPEPYRQATEWFFKASQEYKLKNFKLAIDYASRARTFAEQAEFQAISNGAKTNEAPPPPPEPTPAKVSDPNEYATPTPTPADVYEERKAAEETKKQGTRSPGPGQQAPQGQATPPADLGPLPVPNGGVEGLQ